MIRERARQSVPTVAGLALVALCYLPTLVLDRVAPNAYVWHHGSFSVHFGYTAVGLPGTLVFAALAPLAQYRRRDAFAIPIVLLGVVWVFKVGYRLGRLSLLWTESPVATSEPATASR